MDISDYIERFHNPRMRRRLETAKQNELLLTQPSVKMGWNPYRKSRTLCESMKQDYNT